MSTKTTLRPGGLSIALVLGLLFSPTAWASTAAGINIVNTASVDFTVAGVNQADVTSNTDDFEVDQLIDLNVVESSTSASTVVPDQTTFAGVNAVIRFTITNTGNATQDITVVAANLADGATDPFSVNLDSWDTQGAFAYYLDDGDGNFEPGAGDTVLPISGGFSYLDEVASGGIRVVWVEPADVPANDPGNTLNGDPDQNMDTGSVAVLSMVGTVRIGGVAAALGSTLTNDTAVDDKSIVDIVFGDADGPYDGALDAAESDDDTFTVSTATLTFTKDSTVVTDPVNCTGGSTDPATCGANNAKRIPGAVVKYTIALANAAGSATATSVTVTDAIPANTAYVSGSLYRSADATCNIADTLLSDADDAADDGTSNGTTVVFGNSNGGTDLSLAAATTAYYCYHVTIN